MLGQVSNGAALTYALANRDPSNSDVLFMIRPLIGLYDMQ
ncbi:hypothetical protein VEA_000484 [Vibrio antiquarius]|uniref:Uncharacterized protein n=1 Tax=Vibrio antiquarius (strain Ex25) TaxID=150340 RepID=A0ACA6QT51_VIBAE|nr:hypothetical protein VEA_000484 [Vibrio antiquarius]